MIKGYSNLSFVSMPTSCNHQMDDVMFCRLADIHVLHETELGLWNLQNRIDQTHRFASSAVGFIRQRQIRQRAGGQDRVD